MGLYKCYFPAHLFLISWWQAPVELLALLASIPNGERCPGAQDSVLKKPDSVIPDGSPGELEKGQILTPRTFSIIIYLYAYVHTHLHVKLTKVFHIKLKKKSHQNITLEISDRNVEKKFCGSSQTKNIWIDRKQQLNNLYFQEPSQITRIWKAAAVVMKFNPSPTCELL